MKFAARAALAVQLLLGVYLIGLGLLLGLGWLMVYAVERSNAALLMNALVLFVLTATGFATSVAMSVRAGGPEPDPGTRLDEDGHPTLWRQVRELATTVQTRAPDEIFLVPQVNAAVSERSRFLGLAPGRRTMYLGAPLLIAFSRQQLVAVLAHELGHYSGRHTRLTGVVIRGREALAGILDHFGERSLVGRVFRPYARLYQRTTFALSRLQELEADDQSVAVAGRDAAVSALQELSLVAAAWEHYLEQFVSMAHDAGRRPSDFFEGFGEVLEAPGLQAALATFRTEFSEGPPDPFDSHPPLSARVARLQALPDDGVSLDATPATRLLDDPEADLHALQEWVYRSARLEAVPWKELMHGHRPEAVVRRAELLYGAAKEVLQLQRDLDIGAMTDGVRGRGVRAWVRPHLVDDSPESIRRAARTFFLSVVDEALMGSGGARYSLTWDGSPHLIDTEGNRIDSEAAVDAALASGRPEELRTWLERQGVDLAYVPDFPEPDPRTELLAAPVQVISAIAPVRARRAMFCVVMNHGVLLRRPGAADRTIYWLGRHKRAGALLRRVLSRSAESLLAEPGNVRMEWDDIASVTLRRGRTLRPMVVFTLLDGATHEVRYRRTTRDSGDLLGALRFFLGERVDA